MAYRTLDLTLISAKGLKEINLIGKMDPYAEVSLSGDPRSRQRTKTDIDGSSNPTWNSTLRFTVPADPGAPGTLNIVLRAEKKTFGDKDIGEVHIPLKELLANVSGDGPTQIQFLSYQVRSSNSGKPKGIINLSYKLSERITSHTAAPAGYPPVTKSDSAYAAPAGYPPVTKSDTPYPPTSNYPQSYPPSAQYPPAGAPYPPAASPYQTEKPSKTAEPVMAYPAPSTEKPPKTAEPVTAYPAGSSSSSYPPQYGAPPQYGYGAPPTQYGAPPPQYGAPPPQYGAPPPQYGGYGAPPPQQGYGYPPAQQGYGYQQNVKPQKKKNNFGLGLGAGLLGGAVGGLILGDIVSDSFDGGFDDGGFDF